MLEIFLWSLTRKSLIFAQQIIQMARKKNSRIRNHILLADFSRHFLSRWFLSHEWNETCGVINIINGRCLAKEKSIKYFSLIIWKGSSKERNQKRPHMWLWLVENLNRLKLLSGDIVTVSNWRTDWWMIEWTLSNFKYLIQIYWLLAKVSRSK